MSEEKKYPKVIVGAFIFNDKGELFLKTSPGQNNKYTCVNGKVEWGESFEDAVKRIIKNKTGLTALEVEFIGATNGLNIKQPDGAEDKHMVFLDHKAIVGDFEKLKMEGKREYKWMPVEEWLKIDKSIFGQYIYEIIEKLKKGEEDFENKYKRALADYQNLLKRTAADREEFAKFANERLIMEVLPVYDNLKVSLNHAGDEEKKNGWAEGIKHIVSQFKNILENIGVEEIKTTGEKFDPNTMEAVKQEIVDDPSTSSGQRKQDGIVASELSAGYKLKGKVIRAARVAVYKVKHE